MYRNLFISFLWILDLSCRGGWTISGTPLDLRDPRLLAMAEAERHFLEAEYDEYTATNATGAAFCRSAALIVSPRETMNHKVELFADHKNNLFHSPGDISFALIVLISKIRQSGNDA